MRERLRRRDKSGRFSFRGWWEEEVHDYKFDFRRHKNSRAIRQNRSPPPLRGGNSGREGGRGSRGDSVSIEEKEPPPLPSSTNISSSTRRWTVDMQKSRLQDYVVAFRHARAREMREKNINLSLPRRRRPACLSKCKLSGVRPKGGSFFRLPAANYRPEFPRGVRIGPRAHAHTIGHDRVDTARDDFSSPAPY